MRKLVLAILIVVMIAAVAAAVSADPSIQKFGKNAKIDWTNNVYIASGEGAIPTPREEPNRAKAYLKAKGYARMAAIANLLMAIKGTAITYEATGQDYMADERITQRIEGFVNNVEVVSERKEQYEGHTIVIVEVRAPMFGQDAPGNVFLEAAAQEEPQHEVRVVSKPDAKPTKHHAAPVTPSAPAKPYTSLIIDTTGYKLDRCMSPKIRRLDGSEVWGTVKVDYDFVQDHGIVAYATSLAEAKQNQRCGSNPLIIQAVGRAGGKFYSDPVISDDDAELLLSENVRGKFLDKFCVIFVKDGAL